MENIKDIILLKAYELEAEIIKHRRHIHANPELSFKEFETSKYIQTELDKLNIPYKVMAETGVVGLIGKGDNCVALRADIDALPIKEETDLDFSSENDGVMHACGHDMHASMLLGAAKILKGMESELKGTVKLIFQPGEEKVPGGASVLIDEGVLENPAPRAIFGQHVNPLETLGKISLASGPIMASADELYWTIKGKAGHAAQPHLSSDAVIASAQLILYVQSLLTKFRDPLTPGVISITAIHGGSAPNIFPDEVKLMGTLRSFDKEWRDEMHELLEIKSKDICALYNAKCKLHIEKGYSPVVNNQQTTDIANCAAKELFGDETVLELIPKMWAEDFGYYSLKIPGTFWFLGVRPEGVSEMPPLHNQGFSPDEKALTKGAAMMAYAAVNYLGY